MANIYLNQSFDEVRVGVKLLVHLAVNEFHRVGPEQEADMSEQQQILEQITGFRAEGPFNF